MTARTVTVVGARMRVIGSSAGTREPVLLVHGVGGWAENWRETLRALEAAGHPAYALDLPGFGQSERVRRARYFDAARPFYAELIVGTLDALGLAHAHLVGHSLGGAIAYTAAVHAPDRFSSLVLVAGAGLGLEVAFSLRLAALPGMGLLARLRGRRYARAGLASCFLDPRRAPEELWLEADRYVPPSLGETIRVLRHGLTLRGVRPRLREAWAARAPRFTRPVLVVWGREDVVIPVAAATAARELFPRAEVVVIPDAGHLVMIEQPSAFARALLPFLDRVAPLPR
ncbi:MAG: alpha/beta fold hydrolase [Chloroflexi bacterium]|nr:alpha/beta fold hydrolase [Chloroflexota bacterium]